MYTLSRHIEDFYIAGFAYWDGVSLFDRLSIGTPLSLVEEPDNPHDPSAVAIYCRDGKLGYVPRDQNTQISQALFFGHDIFEAYVSQVNKEAHPSRQVRAVVMLKDIRVASSAESIRL